MSIRHEEQRLSNLEMYNMYKTDEQLEKQAFWALLFIIVSFVSIFYFVFLR